MARYEGHYQRGLKKWQKQAKKRVKMSHKRYRKKGQRTWDSMQRPSEHHLRKRKSRGARDHTRKRAAFPYAEWNRWFAKANQAALDGHHASAAVAYKHLAEIERKYGRKSTAYKNSLRAAQHRRAARAKHGIRSMPSSRDMTGTSARDKRHHRTKGAPPFKIQAKISRKIRLLREEGYPPAQAAAIAYRMYGVERKQRYRRRRAS